MLATGTIPSPPPPSPPQLGISQAFKEPQTDPRTMRFGSIAKVLAKYKLKYYRISECLGGCAHAMPSPVPHKAVHSHRQSVKCFAAQFKKVWF